MVTRRSYSLGDSKAKAQGHSPGMRRLALAARMAADTAVRDSIVPMPSASRLPELGPHGEGWVVLQLLLGAAIAGGGFVGVYWPGSLASFVGVLGLLLALVGALLVVLGVLSLGSSFTPLPRPRARTRLRQGGIFRLVRHPVYGGAILLGLGWSLADAPLGLVPTALLAVLIDLKAQREETWLIERFPDYALYRARTPHRFVPWLY
jgi:protein-S-isoprenylcysteine O-methyltransferase Ste14